MSAQKGNADDVKESEVDTEVEKSDLDIDDTAALSGSTANVGETSVEIDVEELIAELEVDSGRQSDSTESSARKRLEKVLEERRIANELEELDEFDSAGAD